MTTRELILIIIHIFHWDGPGVYGMGGLSVSSYQGRCCRDTTFKNSYQIVWILVVMRGIRKAAAKATGVHGIFRRGSQSDMQEVTMSPKGRRAGLGESPGEAGGGGGGRPNAGRATTSGKPQWFEANIVLDIIEA